MTENAVIVFTGRPPSQIIAEGGTQAWVLNARRARKCVYAVCVQNQHTYEKFNPTEPHKAAFMVGRISEVVLAEEQPDLSENKPERYLIRFSDYADVEVANAWDGSRNPVGYINIRSLGIDPDTLVFKPMPRRSSDSAPVEEGITLAQARIALSKTFGVSPEAIEITIRG